MEACTSGPAAASPLLFDVFSAVGKPLNVSEALDSWYAPRTSTAGYKVRGFQGFLVTCPNIRSTVENATIDYSWRLANFQRQVQGMSPPVLSEIVEIRSLLLVVESPQDFLSNTMSSLASDPSRLLLTPRAKTKE